MTPLKLRRCHINAYGKLSTLPLVIDTVLHSYRLRTFKNIASSSLCNGCIREFLQNPGVVCYHSRTGLIRQVRQRHLQLEPALQQQRCYSHRTLHQADRFYSKSVSLETMMPVTLTDIKKFLSENDIKYEQGHTCLVMSCPLCCGRGVTLDRMNTFFINMTTGKKY